jgi:hypothetical protein
MSRAQELPGSRDAAAATAGPFAAAVSPTFAVHLLSHAQAAIKLAENARADRSAQQRVAGTDAGQNKTKAV